LRFFDGPEPLVAGEAGLPECADKVSEIRKTLNAQILPGRIFFGLIGWSESLMGKSKPVNSGKRSVCRIEMADCSSEFQMALYLCSKYSTRWLKLPSSALTALRTLRILAICISGQVTQYSKSLKQRDIDALSSEPGSGPSPLLFEIARSNLSIIRP